METKKCPYCGGDMVKSKSSSSGYTSYFWKRPWRGLLISSLKIFPWACMNCGVVLFFLEEKDKKKALEEYSKEKYRT